jgi:Type III restriction enzyme, res subunit
MIKYTSLKLKLIYVFTINDDAHKGCVKIGEATSDSENIWGLEPKSKPLNEAAKKRINQYTQTAGIAYDLLYTEIAIFTKKKEIIGFSDEDVHKVLTRSGIKKKIFDTEKQANEWFITDLETAKKAIIAVKEGRDSLHAHEITKDKNPVAFRPEQKDAIEKTKKQFKKSNEMLWNAKMRFGKTLSALQVIKDHQFNRTLILTHRPVVKDGWGEDFNKIFNDSPQYAYGSQTQGNRFDTLEKAFKNKGTKYVYFASMQDLRGSERVGGDFDKNDDIFDISWDFIIVDEAHEGTQTDLGKNVLKELRKGNTKILHLSGTPFNLLDYYKEDEIFTWDYVMEQKAKAEWDKTHFGDPNPYACLPKLNIYTYDLGNIIRGFEDEEVAFNFREFFRVNKNGNFLHQEAVLKFLNLLCKPDAESNYPYSTKEYQDDFRHSLWMVPGVKEAKALKALLKTHSVFGQFNIVNVAGDDDEDKEDEALAKVRNAITKDSHETYTITLSCGRLTTGVSVKEWTAVFMLSGSPNTSAATYMQTIFRVQTPATINGKVKEECFVFDFAPDRTLKVIAETAKMSAKAGKTSGKDREIMSEFLNFCPIIAYDGSRMTPYDVKGMLEQLKMVYVERVVRNGFEDSYLYDNDQLMKLGTLELEEFEGLKKIIGSTKAMPKSGDIDVNKQGFKEEDYEKQEAATKKKPAELTEDDKKRLAEILEQKKTRDSAVSILRGISIRMPLLIYGADINNEEKDLSIDTFVDLVDAQSWEEFMPKGVTKAEFQKFKKYYEPDVFSAAGKRIRALEQPTTKPLRNALSELLPFLPLFVIPIKKRCLHLGGW